MRLIVGLGNPGRRYEATPHNVGFEVLDEVAARHGLRWLSSRKVEAEYAEGAIRGVACTLLKPTTYMNLSGRAVAPMLRRDGIDPATRLLVVVDDVALRVGRLRLVPADRVAGIARFVGRRSGLAGFSPPALRGRPGGRLRDRRFGGLCAGQVAPGGTRSGGTNAFPRGRCGGRMARL